MNTTTCAMCGQDFPDREMLPMPNGGELCGPCREALNDAAPDLLAALSAFLDAWSFISEGKQPEPMRHAARKARAAINKAEGKA